MDKPDLTASNYVDIQDLLETADRLLKGMEWTMTPDDWWKRYYDTDFQEALTKIELYLRSLEGFERDDPSKPIDLPFEIYKVGFATEDNPYEDKISKEGSLISIYPSNFKGTFTVRDPHVFKELMPQNLIRVKIGTDNLELKEQLEKHKYRIINIDPENQSIEFESVEDEE